VSLLPRPGDITVPFRGGPIGMYKTMPQDNVIADIAHYSIEQADGLLLIIAHVGEWCFALASNSMKVGWIYEYDVGPGHVAGAVYHTP
jgi:hypothetical protein